MHVIGTDKSGIYIKESHMAMRTYFVIGGSLRESATLIKVDKQFAPLYKNDYNRELRGKEFEEFIWLNKKLMLIASSYSRRDRTLALYAAEVNLEDGELTGDFTELVTWQKEEKNDNLNFRIDLNSDSTRLMIASIRTGGGQRQYDVQVIDAKLKKVGKPVMLKSNFEPELYELQDLVFTAQNTVAVVGRVYEYIEGKKKKARNREFSVYNVRLYTQQGKLIKEFDTDVPGQWLVSTKLMQVAGKELVLASFYSKAKRERKLEGMVVERFDALDGHAISSSVQKLSAALISEGQNTVSKAEDEDGADDEESRKERKERERLEAMRNEDEGFSKSMRFNQFLLQPDGSMIILAEETDFYVVTRTNWVGSGAGMNGGRTMVTETYYVFENGDLMMSKVDAKGQIAWLNVLPKFQREVTQQVSGMLFSGGFTTQAKLGRPYYGGYGVYQGDKEISILFNDHSGNAQIVHSGQKPRSVQRYGRSECYRLRLNASTGVYQREPVFSNRDVPTAMPRFARVYGSDLLFVGREDRVLGKTKVALGRLQF